MTFGKKRARSITSEAILGILAAASGCALVSLNLMRVEELHFHLIALIVFALSFMSFIRLLMDPDSIRAVQSNSVLRIASETLEYLADGLDTNSAQKVCDLLLPETAAIAVAITDKENILGYSGYTDGNSIQGRKIRTTATHLTLSDGNVRVLHSAEEIGLPHNSRIRAAIIVPLVVAHRIAGTLKFYYRTPLHMSQTQESLASGFAELISTQMAAAALEEKTRLATSMELKALQAQINPHFLFNTINTISALIRTNPTQARVLLRDFAVFYRRALEDSADLIQLDREISQVKRYLSFEIARFGEERLCLEVRIDPALEFCMVPSFMIQPLVENAVRHGMPATGRLTITIIAKNVSNEVHIFVNDNGVGMSKERLATIMHPECSTGLGIAVKNVSDRMRSYFGADARMSIKSIEGCGTTVHFRLGVLEQRGDMLYPPTYKLLEEAQVSAPVYD